MLNCSWSKVWRGLRPHQDSICIKFAVIVFACCGLCMVCYFVESPKAKVAAATADRGPHAGGYQHKQKQSRIQINAAASDMNVQDLRSSEKLIQIKTFLNEDSEPLQLSSSNNIAHASDPYEGSGHHDGEVSLMASSNGIAMPTEGVQLLNDELFLDAPGDSMGSAAADTQSIQLPDDLRQIDTESSNNNHNNNVVVTLQEVPNTEEQDLSGKWLSDEQEYFLNDYGSLNGGPHSSAMVVSDEQFIVSPEDRGNFVQISDATDTEVDDDYDSKYLESPKFINSLLGQMKGLFEPLKPMPPAPSLLPPVGPRPTNNFGEIPFSSNMGLETQASQYQPTWNKPQPLVPNAAVSWFDVWKAAEAPRTPPRNPFHDYLQQMERFFKGQH